MWLCVSFQNSGTLTTTAILGATFTEAPRSPGSSAPCPNAPKVQLLKKQTTESSWIDRWAIALTRVFPLLALFWADKYQECVKDSGQSYRGTKSVTKSGSHCLPWDIPELRRKLYNAWRPDALDLGLGSHSFCRSARQRGQKWSNVHTENVHTSAAHWSFFPTGILTVMQVRGVTSTRTCDWPGSCATCPNAVSHLISKHYYYF